VIGDQLGEEAPGVLSPAVAGRDDDGGVTEEEALVLVPGLLGRWPDREGLLRSPLCAPRKAESARDHQRRQQDETETPLERRPLEHGG
jgi:hypothetical protein